MVSLGLPTWTPALPQAQSVLPGTLLGSDPPALGSRFGLDFGTQERVRQREAHAILPSNGHVSLGESRSQDLHPQREALCGRQPQAVQKGRWSHSLACDSAQSTFSPCFFPPSLPQLLHSSSPCLFLLSCHSALLKPRISAIPSYKGKPESCQPWEGKAGGFQYPHPVASSKGSLASCRVSWLIPLLQ